MVVQQPLLPDITGGLGGLLQSPLFLAGLQEDIRALDGTTHQGAIGNLGTSYKDRS